MASSRSASEDPAKFDLIKDALYQAVVESGSEGRLWSQKELLDLGIIPDQNLQTLVRIIQALCQEFLFRSMQDARAGLCWRYRPAVDAQKYKQLNQDQIMVYELIDDAGADGIWARSLKLRLNMHESVLKQCLKFLETKGYIRDMKSVENIGKKMYIKATLRPSDRATGGPWYTDSTLDEAFIDVLQKLVFSAIQQRSTYRSRHVAAPTAAVRQPKKGVIRGGTSENSSMDSTARGRKRGADALSTGEDSTALTNGHGHKKQARHTQSRHSHHSRRTRYHEISLPMPAGYTGYPTVRQIAEFIEQAEVTNNTTLGESDIQQLVDVLVYDGLLEPVRLPGSHDMGYRVLNAARLGAVPSLDEEDNTASTGEGAPQRGPKGAPPLNNGFTETPCGMCPVFDLCDDGGPVSPANCVYFNQWLGLEETPPPGQISEGEGVEVFDQ